MRPERLLGLRLSIIEGGRELAAAKLVKLGEGNLSARIDQDRFFVTPAMTDKAKLEPDELMEVEINSHRVPEGASTEVGLHRAIYAQFPSVHAVVHAHPVKVLALAEDGLGARSVPAPRRRINPRSGFVDRRFSAREPLAGPGGRHGHRQGARARHRRARRRDHRRHRRPGGAADDQVGAPRPDDPGWVRWTGRPTSTPAIDDLRHSLIECVRAPWTRFSVRNTWWGRDGVIRAFVERRELPSMIFWGPPGSGKTTMARLLAEASGTEMVTFSAVLSGVKEARDDHGRGEPPAAARRPADRPLRR